MDQERLGGPPEGPVQVERPTQSSGRGWEAHPEVHEGLEGPFLGLGGIRRLTLGPEGPPGGQGGVGKPTQRSGRGQEGYPEGRERSRGPPGGV